MLFMVIERTPKDSVQAVGERFREKGRMLPDGVRYEASWLNEDGSVCYQIMEAENRAQAVVQALKRGLVSLEELE